MPRTPWYRTNAFRQVHMDFHMPEFPARAIVNFNAKHFVDHLEHGKVNFVALFAKCHFGNCFYDTKVGHKHAGLPQDFLMETASECRKRGIRTLAYYSLCWEKRAWDENPDWRYAQPDGTTQSNDRSWGSVCMNTPYKDELVMPQLREICERYPVDGLWLDIPFPAGSGGQLCFCPACRNKWKREYGIELSPDLPWNTQMRLRLRTVEDYLAEIRQIINETNPELVVCLNQVGGPDMNRRIKELCEIGTWENQPHVGDYLRHSFASRLGRNDITDLQIMTVRFYEHWGDLSLKPTPQLTTEAAVMIGNGQICNVGDQVNVDGTLQPPVYDTFRESFGFIEAREKLLYDAQTVRHAGVLLPVPDPDLPFNVSTGRLGHGNTHAAWRGCHKMLVESHIHHDLLYSVLEDDLQRNKLLILPEPCAYAPEMYPRLRDYVEQGGTLIAVGASLIHDGQFELQDVFGIEYYEPYATARPEQQAVHFQPAAAVAQGLAEIPLQVRGQAYKVRLDGAEELAALHMPQARYQPPVKAFRSPYSPANPERSPFPFATVNAYGKGKAVYIAAGVFGIYWEWNHHWLRVFVENVIRHVDPNPPFTVDAAGTIEVNLMRNGGDLILALIHYQLAHGGDRKSIAGIERIHPVHDIACTVRCDSVQRVVLEPEGKAIDHEHKDGVCRFTVPSVEYLALVKLEDAAGK